MKTTELQRVLMDDLCGCLGDCAQHRADHDRRASTTWLAGRASGVLLALRESEFLSSEGYKKWDRMLRWIRYGEAD